ncbi:hypothetical protein DCAR_0623976 [Daucus carota subsp. sativus]|uniref:Uncharacterized protein n=1 Tax=Daucus carota subsp. sativus TaxID=79200 RepID=A0A164VJY6_DAUCS|nr:hypothetical protein DCAR_0623976 [Daucus carota subsp. sativus]
MLFSMMRCLKKKTQEILLITLIVGVDDKKTKICYGNHGKRKQVKLNLNMAGSLGDETKEIAVKKTKICYGNNGIGNQLKLNLNMAADETKEVAAKKRKILECYDCESVQHKERLCSPKYRVRQDQPAGVVDNKRKAAAGIDEDEACRCGR